MSFTLVGHQITTILSSHHPTTTTTVTSASCLTSSATILNNGTSYASKINKALSSSQKRRFTLGISNWEHRSTKKYMCPSHIHITHTHLQPQTRVCAICHLFRWL